MDGKVTFESGGALIPWPTRPSSDATPEQQEEYVEGVKRYYVDRVHILREIVRHRLEILYLTPIDHTFSPTNVEIPNFETYLYQIGNTPMYINMIDGTIRLRQFYARTGRHLIHSGLIRTCHELESSEVEENKNIARQLSEVISIIESVEVPTGLALNQVPTNEHIFDILDDQVFCPEEECANLLNKVKDLQIQDTNRTNYGRDIVRQGLINSIKRQIELICNVFPNDKVSRALQLVGYLKPHQE